MVNFHSFVSKYRVQSGKNEPDEGRSENKRGNPNVQQYKSRVFVLFIRMNANLWSL